MDLRKPRQRLQNAQEAFDRMLASSDLDDYERHWIDFLVNGNAIYATLEQATKSSGPATGWFGKKKNERKNDQLLQYLHQARHAEEHTLQEITEQKPSSLVIGKQEPGSSNAIRIDGSLETGLTVQSLDGKPVKVEFAPATLKLMPVMNKGVTYNPPSEHMGSKLKNNSPDAVATLALDHLRKLLVDAESFT